MNRQFKPLAALLMKSLYSMLLIFMLVDGTTTHAEIIPDIVYESPGCTDPALDVHLPDSGLIAGTPTILYIHGGAWVSGDKAADHELLQAISEGGYAVVSGNYTLTTPERAGYPQSIHDVKAMVRWVRTAGFQYGLSSTIVATGPSVGGYYTKFLATTGGIEQFEPLQAPEGGYDIQAGIPFWGLSDLLRQAEDMGSSGPLAWFMGTSYGHNTASLYMEASPVNWADQDDAPMHMVHGLEDPWHPWRQSFWMHEALLAAEVPSSLEYFQGGHGYEAYGGMDAAADMLMSQIPILLASGRTADLNLDGSVDVTDVLMVVDHWGSCPDLPVDCPADLDADGDVGVDDLLEVLQMYGGPPA